SAFASGFAASGFAASGFAAGFVSGFTGGAAPGAGTAAGSAVERAASAARRARGIRSRASSFHMDVPLIPVVRAAGEDRLKAAAGPLPPRREPSPPED